MQQEPNKNRVNYIYIYIYIFIYFRLGINITLPRCFLIPSHSGLRTLSKDSIPYGAAASANAAIAKAVIVRTFCCSSSRPRLQENFYHSIIEEKF